MTASTAPSTLSSTESPCADGLLDPGKRSNAEAGTGRSKWNSIRRSAFAFSSPMSATVASRPSRMMPTRSQTRSTSGITWELSKIGGATRALLRPPSRRRSAAPAGSRPWVGSSRIKQVGTCMNAWIRPIFCLLPCDSSWIAGRGRGRERSARSLTRDQVRPRRPPPRSSANERRNASPVIRSYRASSPGR